MVGALRNEEERLRMAVGHHYCRLPPKGEEQAQEIEAEDEKPVVVSQDSQPQMTGGGLMFHADLED